MARIDTLCNFLTDVANSIRNKKGSSNTITPANFDTEIENIASVEINDARNLFYYGSRLNNLDVFCSSIKNCSNFSEMFYLCSSLTEIPSLDTSEGTSFYSMFKMCRSLTSIPNLDTSNGTSFASMFDECNALTTIPLLDTGKANYISSMLSGCDSLTTLGGFKDLGKSYLTSSILYNRNYILDLSECPNLTHESLMNVINNLYNIASIGVQPQKLILGENYAKLTAEEVAIATTKGWNVTEE